MKKNGTLSQVERRSAFLNFSSQYAVNEEELKEVEKVRNGRSPVIDEIEKAWRQLTPEEKAQ